MKISFLFRLGLNIKKHFELIMWVSGLSLLFFMPENAEGFSFCIFKLVGFSGCLGCGIGHAIREGLHFHFLNSLKQHPLGLLAIIIIFNRIFQLLSLLKNNHETKFN